jgi:hypothetical protein
MEAWYSENTKHRVDGPAVTYYNSNIKVWYKNGLIHREDGPAIEDPNSIATSWWLNGICFKTEEEFKTQLTKLCNEL